jgi:hypothetical protein
MLPRSPNRSPLLYLLNIILHPLRIRHSGNATPSSLLNQSR